MSKKEILFIYINRIGKVNFSYSLGAGYIQAYLLSKGIGSLQFEYDLTYSFDSLVKKILSMEIPIIGFTCYEANYPQVAMLSRALKKRKKDILIIVGGPSPSFADKIILNDCKAIDICVREEGEYTVYELLMAIKEGRSLVEVKSITFRNDGRLVRTPARELISSGIEGAELDIIPSPFLSGVIPIEKCFNKHLQIGIVTTRGCLYRCTYCNFSIMGRQRVRFHSIDRVVEELRLLWKAAKKTDNLSQTIYIHDDTFTVFPERTRKICDEIIKAGLSSLNIWVQTRADKLDFETLDLMCRAGIKKLGIGLESAVPRVLNQMQKVRTGQNGKKDNYADEKRYIKQVKKIVKYAKKLGITIEMSIIQGLPAQSYLDVKKTVSFIKSLGVDEVVQNIINVNPGTELFINSRKYGWSLKKVRMGSIHFSIKNPSQGIYYPEVFPNIELDNLLFLFLVKNFRVFSHALRTGKNESVQEVVIVNSTKFPPYLLNWMSREAGISCRVSFINKSISNKDIERNFISVFRQGFLSYLIQYCIEERNEIGLKTLVLQLASFNVDDAWEKFLSRRIGFHLLPLRLIHCINKLSFHKGIKYNYIIFTLENEKDIEAMIKIAKILNEKGKFIIPKSLTRFTPALEDECRWSDMPCPASSLSKIIVDGKGKIYPCLHGKIVGGTTESISVIRSSIKSFMEKEMSLRKCVECKIQEQCSKCLFPYPIDRQRYCQMRKSHPNLHKVASMMKIPRSILWKRKRTLIPQRLVFLAENIYSSEKNGLPIDNQVISTSGLDSLYKLLKEIRRYKDDIIFFYWGKERFIGFRRHEYSSFSNEALEVQSISSQFFKIIFELLLGKSTEKTLLCFKKKYPLDKYGIEQTKKLLKFLKKRIHYIQHAT